MKPPPELIRGFKDKKYLDKVSQLPCIACLIRKEHQTSRTEIHHKWGIGAGKKASDRLTIPLCNLCHTGSFGGAKKGITLHYNLTAFEQRHGTQDQLIHITNEILKKYNNDTRRNKTT